MDSLQIHCQELSHLKQCNVVLPPGIVSKSHQEIIGIHHQVNETIQYNGDINVPIVPSIDIHPIDHEDGKVMVDMKEGELLPFLSDDNKESIAEIKYLAQVE